MFKEKSSKKRLPVSQNPKDCSTLDAQHQCFVQQLQDQQAKLHVYQSDREDLCKELAKWKAFIEDCSNTESADYNAAWSSNLNLQQRLKELDKVIHRLESCQDEIEYYENTGNILFQYYNLLENQNCANAPTQTISMTPSRATKGRKKLLPVSSRSILDALSSADAASTSQASLIDNQSTPSTVAQGLDKATLVEEYLSVIDPNHVANKPMEPIGLCEECDAPLICLQQDGIMVCGECGYQELLLVEQNRPILRQPTKETSHFSYKRINHFKEWIAQIQGKESTDIPEEVFEKILGEIKKEKITDPKKITYNKMREILKRLRINKYYEHINYIMYRINGTPMPHFSPELEERLCSMFKEIQGAFLRHCPPTRKNFMSYSYVLHKFFQILGLEEYLPYCSLLKSREKLHMQDIIMSKICDDLGWSGFKPSV